MENQIYFKNIKLLIMLLLGLILIIKPNSLLAITIFTLGIYLIFIGFNSLINFLIIIRHNEGWVYYCIKGFSLIFLGALFIFNTNNIVITISTILFILIGLSILSIGTIAVIRAKEYSAGIVLIIVGLLILLFPLGVSSLITKIIGVILVGISIYLITLNTKSS